MFLGSGSQFTDSPPDGMSPLCSLHALTPAQHPLPISSGNLCTETSMYFQKIVVQRLISPSTVWASYMSTHKWGDGLPSFYGPSQHSPSLRKSQHPDRGQCVSARPSIIHPFSTTRMSALDDGVWVNGTVCNAWQYNQSLSSRNSPNPTISCLTHGQTIGLAVGAQSLSVYCLNLSRI